MRKLRPPNLSPRAHLAVVALAAIAAQVVLNLPVWDWPDRAPVAATAAGVAIAVVAGAVGGVIPGLLAAVAGWGLNVLFVADQSLESLLALPAWLAAGGAAGWLAARLRERSRERRLAESRLAVLREAASDAIVRIDADGLIAAWSPGAEALYGYSTGEVVGRPVAALLEGADAGDHVDRLVESVRSRERLSVEELDQRRRDGSSFSATVTLLPSATEPDDPPEAIFVARDDGEQRRLTDRLHTAEGKYRSLTEHLPVVTYVRSLSDEGETTFVGPQIDRLVGYTADEWLADPDLFLRLVHPDDRDRVAAERATVDAGKGLGSSYRMIARDGRTVQVREEAVVVLDEGGRPLCIQGYLLDVSERKAAEDERKELRAAEAETAADARDRQRKIDFVADAAAVLSSSLDVKSTTGQVASLAVRDLADWCVLDILEEDRSVTRVAAKREPSASSAAPEAQPEPAVLEVIRSRRPELSESHMRLPLLSRGDRAVGAITFETGEHGHRYVADDLSWARTVAGMVALAIDTSRLHGEVEARSDAHKVLNHVGEGVFLLDRGGLIRVWNPATAAITGVPAEAAVGKAASETIPGWPEVSELVPIGTTRDPLPAATLPLDTETGGERWISIAGVEFYGGTVYAFRDVTEEHRLDELKAEFIATASHELRTPLAAVYGAAQTLRRHDFALDDAGRGRFISLIVDESEHLARIVNHILLASQLEVGRLDLVTEPFEAEDLLERVVEAAKTYAPKEIQFDVQAANGVSPVAADRDRARQVLVNLVENAIKYSPGGGRIELGVEPTDGAVLFRVVDEGMGIPADEQARIFEKFYRLDPAMTQGIGGTGLGLYICRELVERMGGRIWLKSDEGKGSTFFFELPIVGAHRPLIKTREPAAKEQAGATPPAASTS